MIVELSSSLPLLVDRDDSLIGIIVGFAREGSSVIICLPVGYLVEVGADDKDGSRVEIFDGAYVGEAVGLNEGDNDGKCDKVGDELPLILGDTDRKLVGGTVGSCDKVGFNDPAEVGRFDGCIEFAIEGRKDGSYVGSSVGFNDACFVGENVGEKEACKVGLVVGSPVGMSVGLFVGIFVGVLVGLVVGNLEGAMNGGAVGNSSKV